MIYLDNASTTKPQKAAQDALIETFENFGNPSSLHGLGLASEKVIIKASENVARVLGVINTLYNNGKELKNFIEVYLEFILDLVKFNLIRDINCTSIPSYLAAETNPVVQQTIDFPDIKNWLNDLADLLLKIKLETKYDSFYKSTIEAFLIRFCR